MIALALPIPDSAVATNADPVINPLPEIAPFGALSVTKWLLPALSGDVSTILPDVDTNKAAPLLVMPAKLGLPNCELPVTVVSFKEPELTNVRAPPEDAAKFETEFGVDKETAELDCAANPCAVIAAVCVIPPSPSIKTLPLPALIAWLSVNVFPVPVLSWTSVLLVTIPPAKLSGDARVDGSLTVRFPELVNTKAPVPVRSAVRKETLLLVELRPTAPFVCSANSPPGATSGLVFDCPIPPVVLATNTILLLVPTVMPAVP